MSPTGSLGQPLREPLRHERTPSDIPGVRGRIPVSDALEIAFRKVGEGREALIVPAESWLGPDLEPLARDRCVVFYDLRGRGRSSAVSNESKLGLAKDVADLEAVRRTLNLSRVSLLGWSYHGAVAARYALRYPERVERLILVAPTAPMKEPFFSGFLERFSRSLRVEDLVRLDRLRAIRLPETDPEAWSREVHQLYFRSWVGDAGCLEHMLADPVVEPNTDAERVNDQGRRVVESLGEYDWREDFHALNRPVLLIHGRLDPVMVEGTQMWTDILPDARLLMLSSVGHMPWLEAPTVFFPAIQSFLDRGSWPVGAATR